MHDWNTKWCFPIWFTLWGGFFFIPSSFQWPHRYISRQPIIAAIDVRFYGTKGHVTEQETWYATWRRKHSWANSNSRSKTRPLNVTATGKWEDLFFPIFTCQADSVGKEKFETQRTKSLCLKESTIQSPSANNELAAIRRWDFQNGMLEGKPQIIQRTGLIQPNKK